MKETIPSDTQDGDLVKPSNISEAEVIDRDLPIDTFSLRMIKILTIFCVCVSLFYDFLLKKKIINRMMLLWYGPGSNPQFRFPLFRRVMETKRIYLKWHKEMKNQNQIEFGVIKTKNKRQMGLFSTVNI